MNKDIIRQAAENYADSSFVHPLNAHGEPMTIPSGQTVPHGYRKHFNSAKKHFLAGVEWHSEVSSIKEDVVQPSKHGCPFMSFMAWTESLYVRSRRYLIKVYRGKV